MVTNSVKETSGLIIEISVSLHLLKIIIILVIDCFNRRLIVGLKIIWTSYVTSVRVVASHVKGCFNIMPVQCVNGDNSERFLSFNN